MVDFEADIKNCIAVLENGGTILYPTDTVWGIGCNALDHIAADRVFEIKQRPKNKSMIILLADARDVLKYVATPPPDIISIIESFETPTTIIYDGALELADNIINKDGSIAIRVTNDPFCKALIKRFRKPIVSTSANISGDPTPAIYNQIHTDILDMVDYIVKYRQDDEHPATPSRLIKITADGGLHVLRG